MRTTYPLTNQQRERLFSDAEPEPNSGCWLWTGTQTSKDGHGIFQIRKGLRAVAHRVMYAAEIGPIPEGAVLDHLCRVPCCVNPAHVEPVTQRENVLRGVGPSARRARQSECIHGHPLSGVNLLIAANGGRHCRACARAAERRYRMRRKALATEARP